MTGGVLANLDVEAVVGGKSLPVPLLRRLSAVGSLMRVFAEPGEPLWTPMPVERRRVPPVEGVACPDFVSGEQAMPPSPRRAWCGHADPRLLSRRFDLECERSMGDGLRGCRWIEDMGQLTGRLREGDHGQGGAWVLKPAFSAAGRGALRGRGGALLDGTPVESSSAVASLLAEPFHGAVLEPWVERLGDFGCRARIEQGRVEIDGCHRLLVTPSGGFRGVQLPAGDGPLPDLLPEEVAQLVAAVVGVGARLTALGCTGPFGVDAFAYRGREGQRRFRAQCEINVRNTLGFVAAAFVRRVERVRAWEPDASVSLHIGKGAVPERAAVPLLEPASVDGTEADDTSAWLEVTGPPSST